VGRLLANSALEAAIALDLSRAACKPVEPRATMLVSVIEDPYYLGLFGRIITSIQQRSAVRSDLFFLRSLSVGEGASWARWLNARLFAGPLSSAKWKRLYRAFAQRTGYSSTSIKPVGDLVDFIRARRAWKGLRSKSDLLSMRISGVPVGDLVNDSFLRFKPAPTLDITDPYLVVVLWQAFRDVRRAKRYFESVRPRVFLANYSTYVQHGIAVRVALASGTAVFTFGNHQDFAKRLTLSDWVHTKNPDDYAAGFERIEDKASGLAGADAALSSRMLGGVDSATAYMRTSAYVESTSQVPDVNGAVVVFLHDFYDSPHIYRDMVFSDFWEWTCFTIDVLTERGIRFLVKPHPNQVSLSSQVLVQLKDKYPGLAVVPQGVTNRQLAQAGMQCAVTVYGTVAHEMAYLGIPTIACARHPHASFDFCTTATSREEYRQALLAALDHPDFDRARAKEQSLRFFHMHNRNLGRDEMELRDAAISLWGECGQTGAEPARVVAELRRLGELKGFQAFVDTCAEIIDGR
jgi:hypothetical protein